MSRLRRFSSALIVLAPLFLPGVALSYPPTVGITSPARNCLACHADNGPWKEGDNLVIDILDKATLKSLRQPDGSFLISAKRGQPTIVLTVIGYRAADEQTVPYRNAWLYVDTTTIGNSSLTKFAPGWDVNLPLSCRLVGDKLEMFSDARITSLPMILMATAQARESVVMLQVVLTKGEAVKGKAKEGMLGNYFERSVKLKVEE